MQIDLWGKTARIDGAAHPIGAALRDRLAENGAMIVPDGCRTC